MTTGILPFDELKKKVTLNTGFFETSKYTEDEQMYITSGNHDNAGMSGGNLQYNFGAANRLNELWQYMLNNYESICIAAFGAHTTEYNKWKTAILSAVRQDKINFGADITDPNNDHAIIYPYNECLGNLLITPESKAKYYEMRDAYYFAEPYDLFRQMSCTSRAALASFFDIMINRGRYYPINLIQVDFENIDINDALTDAEKEAQKIYQINVRGNEEENAMNDALSLEFVPRRISMANQGGNYHGDLYEPEIQFDINQEIAIGEKVNSTGIVLGTIDVNNLYLGANKIDSLYLGATFIGSFADPYTTSKVPQTQFRTGMTWEGQQSGSVNIDANMPIWVDVQNFVACRTYYTIDGSTPTTGSDRYIEPIKVASSCTLKTLTVSVAGVEEAVKTLTVNVANKPVTTIYPISTTQNNIPITITLTAENATTIYYRIGTGAQQTYSAPFTVNQSHTNVQGTNITIYYWSVGEGGTEVEKSITYNTAGAIPAKVIGSALNGDNKVILDWEATANTTAYTVYRSTTPGAIGTMLDQYLWDSTYTDATAINGNTYYYTIRSQNYSGNFTDSDQVTGKPVAPPVYNYRYLKVEGYGQVGAETTTRLIEFEAWTGAINAMTQGGKSLSFQTIDTGLKDITAIYNEAKTTAANTYPIWWGATPNANVVIDFGSVKTFTKLNYYSYSNAGDQRANRFKVLASNTNNGSDWVTLWDMSANTTPQPILPNGYEKVL